MVHRIIHSEPAKKDSQCLSGSHAGLPPWPLPKEVAWAKVHRDALPPTVCMPSPETVTDRLELQSQLAYLKAQLVRKPSRVVHEHDISSLGLPALPNGASCVNTTASVVQAEPPTPKTRRAIKRFSPMEHYGVDESTLNRLLGTTATLIERMPSQSAADCLMDMPSWMRNIFLARHGVPRVVGLMLASRLEEAGETSIIGSDGFVEVHNVPAPEHFNVAAVRLQPTQPHVSCALSRLTAPRKQRRPGVVIRNPNSSVQQKPKLGNPYRYRFESISQKI